MKSMFNSPVTIAMLSGEKKFRDVQWAVDGQTLVWCEQRGAQGVVVVSPRGAAPRDVSGELNVRGGVGYGGGEFAVHEDFIVFVADNRLYRVGLHSGAPLAITPEMGGGVASPSISPNGEWVAFVYSDGTEDSLCAVQAGGKRWPQKLVIGRPGSEDGPDFVMQPSWSPDGGSLAWTQWNQPAMPWDNTEIRVADVEYQDAGLVLRERFAIRGELGELCSQQPVFSPDGKWLAYISDPGGFAHVMVRDLQSGASRQLTSGEREFGGPAWIQGLRFLAWSPDSQELLTLANEAGEVKLHRLSLGGMIKEVAPASAYQSVSQPCWSNKGFLTFLGSSSQIPARVVVVDGEEAVVAARATAESLRVEELSAMRSIEWKSDEQTVFGNYYPPTGASESLPPAIIMVHGGPTSQRTASFDARNQFFATRGFAVLDVNYRGSTGYGRAYQDALRGEWGIVDVKDLVEGAKHLAEAGLADPERLVILGGSSGGYAVLQALTDFPGTFRAGVCLYGIGNLFSLAMGTHKFEAAYNDQLLGPLPEAAAVYRERSPLFKADRIQDAVAVYHGREDKVVPIDQAEGIVAALRRRGVPHVYHVYDNEGHGWRRPENITHFYESVLQFLQERVVFA